MTSEGTGQIPVPSSSTSVSVSPSAAIASSSSSPSAAAAAPPSNPPPTIVNDGLPPLAFSGHTLKLKSLLESNSIVEVMEALETLLIYTKNLILYPEEKKYRKIKITNIHYQERLGHLSGAMEAMEAIGYIPVGEYLRLDEQRMKKENRMNESVLKEIEVFILNRLQDIKKHWGSMPLKLANSHSYSSVQGAAVYSAIGKRHNMEDDEIIVDNFCGEAGQGYFGLYDGHGGRATVDFVVKALHMNLEQQMKKNPAITLAEAFKNSYLATDGQLRRQNILRSGSTSVTCVIRYVNGKRMLFTANVGDSRAILCRGGKGLRLTIDHKASLPEEAKRITEAGGFIGRNKRVNGVLAITRALGDHMLKENDVVTADPYCSDTELTSEDSLIILACDGVWDVMTDQEACDFTLEKVKYYRTKYEEKLKKDSAAKKDATSVQTEEKNSSDMNGISKKNEDLIAPTGSDDGEKGDATSPSSSASFAKFAGYPDWGAVEEDTEIPANLNEVLFYASKALVREALERRSLDNITVMLILL